MKRIGLISSAALFAAASASCSLDAKKIDRPGLEVVVSGYGARLSTMFESTYYCGDRATDRIVCLSYRHRSIFYALDPAECAGFPKPFPFTRKRDAWVDIDSMIANVPPPPQGEDLGALLARQHRQRGAPVSGAE